MVRSHADQMLPRTLNDQTSNEYQLPFDILISTFDIQPQQEAVENEILEASIMEANSSSSTLSTVNSEQLSKVSANHNPPATRSSGRERQAPTYLRDYVLF